MINNCKFHWFFELQVVIQTNFSNELWLKPSVEMHGIPGFYIWELRIRRSGVDYFYLQITTQNGEKCVEVNKIIESLVKKGGGGGGEKKRRNTDLSMVSNIIPVKVPYTTLSWINAHNLFRLPRALLTHEISYPAQILLIALI